MYTTREIKITHAICQSENLIIQKNIIHRPILKQKLRLAKRMSKGTRYVYTRVRRRQCRRDNGVFVFYKFDVHAQYTHVMYNINYAYVYVHRYGSKRAGRTGGTFGKNLIPVIVEKRLYSVIIFEKNLEFILLFVNTPTGWRRHNFDW